MEREEGDKTLVQIGNSALLYTNGTATVSCATTCWVQYDDKAWDGALEDVGEALGGLGSMLGSTCCFVGGCCLLLLGLILGLTINDKTQTVVVQGGGGGMVGVRRNGRLRSGGQRGIAERTLSRAHRFFTSSGRTSAAVATR